MRFIDDITNFIFIEDNVEKADIIFIPGSSYPETAERAAELFLEGYAPILLPSGKYSVTRGYFPGVLSKSNIYTKGYSNEWDFLKDVLVKNGVDENCILKEDQATNTYENSIFSRKETDRLNLNIKKAIICCKSCHARRALMYYELLYPETEFIIIPVDIDGITKENWFKTEKGIDNVMNELGKCGGQFKDIVKAIGNINKVNLEVLIRSYLNKNKEELK